MDDIILSFKYSNYDITKLNYIKLKSIFNHSLRKYKIKFLLEYVIKILYTGLSFRKVI